jgi:transposase-like protein
MAGSPRKDRTDQYTVLDLQGEFPTDDACLDWLWRHLHSADGQLAYCPKCDRERRFHRVKARQSYSCDSCGHHIHPTAGTIFHKSTTPLRLWFHAVFLMSQTRCGISARQVQREIGVTYKTAWRMCQQIRSMLAEEEGPLGGEGVEVEADETYVGGKARQYPKRSRAEHLARKVPVFGAVERGGRIVAKVMPDARAVRGNLMSYVLPTSRLYTDDANVYTGLEMELTYRDHLRIAHYTKVFVDGDVHTQTIDGFFALVKNAIRGVHHGVSRDHLQRYLDEFTFRYNHRDDGEPMFKLFLKRVCLS